MEPEEISVKYDPAYPTVGLVGEPTPHKQHQNQQAGLDLYVSVINFTTGEACFKKLYQNARGMRVLFLDVDGVLNSRDDFDPDKAWPPLNQAALSRLRHVVKKSGCYVVLSSTWRKRQEHVDLLKAAGGFPSPHDDWRTIEQPFIVTNGIIRGVAMRGNEIAEWLSRHPEVERYAIVDDDGDMLPEQLPFFVQTSFETGLTDAHAERLIAILST